MKKLLFLAFLLFPIFDSTPMDDSKKEEPGFFAKIKTKFTGKPVTQDLDTPQALPTLPALSLPASTPTPGNPSEQAKQESTEYDPITRTIILYLTAFHNKDTHAVTQEKRQRELALDCKSPSLVELYVSYIKKHREERKQLFKQVNDQIGYQEGMTPLFKPLAKPYDPSESPDKWLEQRTPDEISYISQQLLLTDSSTVSTTTSK